MNRHQSETVIKTLKGIRISKTLINVENIKLGHLLFRITEVALKDQHVASETTNG